MPRPRRGRGDGAGEKRLRVSGRLTPLCAAGKTLVVMLASHGIRYTTHPMWSAVKAEAAKALPSPPNTDKGLPTVQWKSADYMP